MKRLTLLSILVPLLLPSCASIALVLSPFEPESPYAAFEGQIRNLEYAGQKEEVVYESSGMESSPMPGGGIMNLYYFQDPDVTLCFFVPFPYPDQTVDTDSKEVTVKLIRGYYSVMRSDVKLSEDRENWGERREHLRRHLGEELTGSLTLRYENSIEFDIAISLTSDSGVVFEGDFRSPFERVKFMQWPGTQSWHQKSDAN